MFYDNPNVANVYQLRNLFTENVADLFIHSPIKQGDIILINLLDYMVIEVDEFYNEYRKRYQLLLCSSMNDRSVRAPTEIIIENNNGNFTIDERWDNMPTTNNWLDYQANTYTYGAIGTLTFNNMSFSGTIPAAAIADFSAIADELTSDKLDENQKSQDSSTEEEWLSLLGDEYDR